MDFAWDHLPVHADPHCQASEILYTKPHYPGPEFTGNLFCTEKSYFPQPRP